MTNLREADERRESAFRELEHSHKLSSIGRLAAGVAHEINNPMAIINEKAGLMKDLVEYDAQFRGKEKFLGLTDSILKSVERCKTITHRLLGFAKRMEVQLEILDLNEIIQKTLDFLEREALYRNIILRLRLADNLPRVSSDRGQLQQVLTNLFMNAADAMKGKGHLIIEATYDSSKEHFILKVSDTGPGISKDLQDKIFDIFFTTKPVGKGTGLGLSITKNIIHLHGGNITVDSTPGNGTTFIIELPLGFVEQSVDEPVFIGLDE